jgi:uncharacterized Zn-finger protein
MMLSVKCPGCSNVMRCNPKDAGTASKRCVYCGKSFKIITSKGNRIV